MDETSPGTETGTETDTGTETGSEAAGKCPGAETDSGGDPCTGSGCDCASGSGGSGLLAALLLTALLGLRTTSRRS
jgi:MYXO-CTERM domain-containing protein